MPEHALHGSIRRDRFASPVRVFFGGFLLEIYVFKAVQFVHVDRNVGDAYGSRADEPFEQQ